MTIQQQLARLREARCAASLCARIGSPRLGKCENEARGAPHHRCRRGDALPLPVGTVGVGVFDAAFDQLAKPSRCEDPAPSRRAAPPCPRSRANSRPSVLKALAASLCESTSFWYAAPCGARSADVSRPSTSASRREWSISWNTYPDRHDAIFNGARHRLQDPLESGGYDGDVADGRCDRHRAAWYRTTQSSFSANDVDELPFPSSPHWPQTTPIVRCAVST